MGQMSQEFPAQFSNLTGMGQPVESYRTRGSLTINLILAGFFFLGGSGALVYVLVLLWNRWGRYYPPAVLQTILPWAVGSLAAFVIALVIVWKSFQNRKKAAVVFTHGFAFSDRKGVQAWRWEQVHEVLANVVRHYTNGIYTGTSHTYTITFNSGEKIILNDTLKNVEGLVAHLENNTLQQRYQRLAEAYNNAQPISFGSVTIGKKMGIKIGKKTYRWDEIEEVAIHKGVLSIKKKDGRWFSKASASAGTIPNLQVLLSIINQIIGLKAGR